MGSPFHRPTTLNAALQVLASEDVTIAAGCTDLFPATEHKALQGSVLDITAIPALRGITVLHDGGIRIGATTTWATLIRTPLPAAFDGLKDAAGDVGARQIQNQATLAGNLCNASPAADGVPPLLTLDAQVEIQSHGSCRSLPLSAFLKGPRQIALAPGELVTAITVPPNASAGLSHFKKLGARDYLVISIAMTAARIVFDQGIVTDVALAIGSCGPVAVRLPKIEQALVGKPLDLSQISDARVSSAISPIDDIRGDAAYRYTSAAELMRRTVAELIQTQEVAV